MGLSAREGRLLPAPKRVLEEHEVVDALCGLERDGLAIPWAWTLGPEAAK